MSQLYFSLFMVGGVRGREKYVWSFPGTFTLMYEVQIWLVCSKLSTWYRAYQFVYFLAFCNTHSALGFILHRRGPQKCKNTKKTGCCWILKSLVRNCRCGRFSSSWNYRLCTLSRWLFSMCAKRDSSECALCHETLCTSPAAVECIYYIPSLRTVSRHNFLSLSLLSPEIKKMRLASKILQARPHFLKEE